MKGFVIMPFGNDLANTVFENSTKPVCKEFDIDAERADEIITPNPIIDDIISAIQESTVIIADVSDKNPNVFYELGIAHMTKPNQTIIITQEEYKKLPFDIQHFRVIRYEDTFTGKTKYEIQLRKMLKNILKDYKSIYKNEFELVINIRVSSKNEGDLYSLMALAKTKKPLRRADKLKVDGHNTKTGNASHAFSVSVENALKTFLGLEYAVISGDFIILSDKGKAFVEVLEDKDYVLDKLNDNPISNKKK